MKKVCDMTGCERLVDAFQIFSKYTTSKYPTNCSHDLLFVDVDSDKVSKGDISRLGELGFFVDEDSSIFWASTI